MRLRWDPCDHSVLCGHRRKQVVSPPQSPSKAMVSVAPQTGQWPIKNLALTRPFFVVHRCPTSIGHVVLPRALMFMAVSYVMSTNQDTYWMTSCVFLVSRWLFIYIKWAGSMITGMLVTQVSDQPTLSERTCKRWFHFLSPPPPT